VVMVLVRSVFPGSHKFMVPSADLICERMVHADQLDSHLPDQGVLPDRP
jgi:hypothetical protein